MNFLKTFFANSFAKGVWLMVTTSFILLSKLFSMIYYAVLSVTLMNIINCYFNLTINSIHRLVYFLQYTLNIFRLTRSDYNTVKINSGFNFLKAISANLKNYFNINTTQHYFSAIVHTYYILIGEFVLKSFIISPYLDGLRLKIFLIFDIVLFLKNTLLSVCSYFFFFKKKIQLWVSSRLLFLPLRIFYRIFNFPTRVIIHTFIFGFFTGNCVDRVIYHRSIYVSNWRTVKWRWRKRANAATYIPGLAKIMNDRVIGWRYWHMHMHYWYFIVRPLRYPRVKFWFILSYQNFFIPSDVYDDCFTQTVDTQFVCVEQLASQCWLLFDYFYFIF